MSGAAHERTDRRWNSNLHAFERLLREIPAGTGTGLDVGCGEGETTRRLRRRVTTVTGVDVDEPSIEVARSFGDDIEYRCVDVIEEALAERFDVVTSVAMLHHVDHEVGLTRMAELVRPGGLLLVVGLARSRDPANLARDAWDSVALRRHSITKGIWATTAPIVWPPPLTHREADAATRRALPGARFRRLPYFRFGISWTRPG